MSLSLGRFEPYAQRARAMLDRQKVRVAIAGADDDDTLVAAGICVREFDVSVTLFGKASKIESLAARAGAPLDRMDVVDAPSPQAAAQMATSLVSSGGADILMKGQVKTADFMRAVLNQEWGLRTGRVLSHVGALDMPRFDRMLFVTDGGINVAPDLKTKVEIVQNAIEMVRALGYTEPKVALLGAIETVNPEMQITTDAAAIAKMADRGQVKGALVDGPLALDTAVSPVAAEQKGLTGPVAGRADVLVVPNLESGNVLAKSMLYFGEAIMAGIVMGARKPIVLNSRADTAENKAASLALAVLLSR
ncbi:MAG: bifunctional enoyl-CoA hydratase/phosphate acetyltransferase [Firmicutes bacterium]|nr:bifunctional enoyl-CoA hydratase/phosphate acetyltransferase [Bacillota bacterium]